MRTKPLTFWIALVLCLFQTGTGLRSSIVIALYGPEKAKKICPCCRTGHCTMPCCRKAHIPPGVASYTCQGAVGLHTLADLGDPASLESGVWSPMPPVHPRLQALRNPRPREGHRLPLLKVPIA